jgi:hypothetical protein
MSEVSEPAASYVTGKIKANSKGKKNNYILASFIIFLNIPVSYNKHAEDKIYGSDNKTTNT